MENAGNVAWLAVVSVRLVSLENVVLGMTLARHRRNVVQLRLSARLSRKFGFGINNLNKFNLTRTINMLFVYLLGYRTSNTDVLFAELRIRLNYFYRRHRVRRSTQKKTFELE